MTEVLHLVNPDARTERLGPSVAVADRAQLREERGAELFGRLDAGRLDQLEVVREAQERERGGTRGHVAERVADDLVDIHLDGASGSGASLRVRHVLDSFR